MKKALFISFQLYLFYWIFQFVHVLTVSYNMYKILKMPAHVHLQIDALYSFHKYLFYISQNKAMLIQLLICHIYIHKTKSTDKNTVKVPNR